MYTSDQPSSNTGWKAASNVARKVMASSAPCTGAGEAGGCHKGRVSVPVFWVYALVEALNGGGGGHNQKQKKCPHYSHGPSLPEQAQTSLSIRNVPHSGKNLADTSCSTSCAPPPSPVLSTICQATAARTPTTICAF